MQPRKQLYAQISATLYAQLQEYKMKTGKSIREIIEEALQMLFSTTGYQPYPLRGKKLVEHASKYMTGGKKKEDIVSKIDEIVYGT